MFRRALRRAIHALLVAAAVAALPSAAGADWVEGPTPGFDHSPIWNPHWLEGAGGTLTAQPAAPTSRHAMSDGAVATTVVVGSGAAVSRPGPAGPPSDSTSAHAAPPPRQSGPPAPAHEDSHPAGPRPGPTGSAPSAPRPKPPPPGKSAAGLQR